MTLDQKLKETKRIRMLVEQMSKPDNFTYMDIAILDDLLKDLESYIAKDKTNKELT